MRYFPRAGRRRELLFVMLAALGLLSLLSISLISPVATPRAQAEGDLDHRAQLAKDKLHEAEEALEGSSSRARQAAAALASAETKLSAARQRLKDAQAELAEAQHRDDVMQQRLDRAEARLETARAELEQARLDLEAKRVEVRTLVTDIYTQGNPQLLAFAALLQAQTPADLTRQAELRNGVVSSETGDLRDLNTLEISLGLREVAVERATDEVAALRASAARNLRRTTKLADAARQAEAEVSTLVGERMQANREAAAARKADAQRLAEAKAEDRRVKALLRERARQAALAAQQNNGGETGDSDGYLSYPVNGRITSPFGYRHHPIYGYWGLHDGVDFAASCGTPMRAPADGTVVSRYWSNSYGNRLIIDHGFVAGHGLATILNHATSYTVGTGAKVTRGQVVGYVGSTGWSTGCHLHFTVMSDGNPVDPMTWL